MFDSFRTARGVFRSLRIYYGGGRNRAAMDALYAQFVHPGDLVFDVGAHVGDRIAAFRRLGCRVVACEPQPALVKTLRLIYGRDANVTIEPVAVGRNADANRLYQMTTTWLIVMIWPFYLTWAALAHPLMRIFGDGYQTASAVGVVLSLSMLVAT